VNNDAMKKNTLPLKLNQFSSAAWSTLSALAASTFRFNERERAHLYASKTAQLIAAIPYLAGCLQAERTALSHLAVYILSCQAETRAIFDHTPADNDLVMTRLASIMQFTGGNRAIIKRGMSLLAIQMICGYNRDLAKDVASGEYNPLLDQAWHGQELIDSLILDIIGIGCPGMDLIMTIEEAQDLWWN
jgi:hypothetical protein